MKGLTALFLFFAFIQRCILAQSDTAVEPLLVSDSLTFSRLDSMSLIGGASNAFFNVRILQAGDEGNGTLARTIYIALQRIGERVDRKVYKLRTLASPKVERIELGQMAFKMTVVYDFDPSKKRVTATLKLDRLMHHTD